MVDLFGPERSGMSSSETLFNPERAANRRIVVTGQVGLNKKPFLEQVVQIAAEHGKSLRLFNIGDMMYGEAPDLVAGRILDLPLGRLNALRRAVFKDVLVEAQGGQDVMVNTHATFRWRHGLFPAFDFDHMQQFDADLYITLVDNLDVIHENLSREHVVSHSLKDIMVWREEEILATEVLASSLRKFGCFYILARGEGRDTAKSLYSLIYEPEKRKVYPSFPMTHVMDLPETLAEIDAFRNVLSEHFITFDPGDLDEKRLLFEAGSATQRGEDKITLKVSGREVTFSVAEITSVASDIDGQIYARDFKLVDQSDMIVSFVPEMPDGKPGLSSGVERELQHAYEVTKEVYVVWKPACEPSPFITETATKVFKSVEEALQFFQQSGYIGEYQLNLVNPQKARERGRFG